MTLNPYNPGSIAGGLISVVAAALSFLIPNSLMSGTEIILGHEVSQAWFVAGGMIGLLMIISYIIATVTVKSASGTEDSVTSFLRGVQIGLNSVANGGLIWIFFGGLLDSGLVTGLALGLGAVTLLSCIGPVSQFEFYQGLLGYLNWFLPMSWPIVAVGFLFLVVSALLSLIPANYLRIQDGAVDWKTGTFSIKGGLIANMNPIDTAFNMGNFSFVDYKSGSMHVNHEAGHTLNLAAFGFIFHLVGALDENVFGSGARAFSEFLAESNVSGGSPALKMWS